MSVAEAQKILQVQDKSLMSFPEVERVFGKAGRATTSTDPAPFTMMETTVLLKPEKQWRQKPRWYSDQVSETRTLWHQRALCARLPRRVIEASARVDSSADRAGPDPDGRDCGRHVDSRPIDDPGRKMGY